ncbi:MAG: recombination mediator RecR [Bacteroidaceae bacterium]|nr:recombination mediator RecR [Bacteroidaceae bacterium]
MINRSYGSAALDNAVDAFASLPGIGRKTALRLVLHLLRQPECDVENFGSILSTLKKDIHYCKNCHNISETEICSICSDSSRDRTRICIVENIQDVMAIENTMQYNGMYHVLGGIISPIDGIGPADLEIASLLERCKKESIQEIIFALSPTMEGDTTAFFISRQIGNPDIKMSVIARGIAVGNSLEYADELSLGRSIINRTKME